MRSMRICATSQLVKAGRVLNASSYWTHLRIACGWEITASSMMDVDEISGEVVVLRVLSKEESLVYLVKLEPIR